MIKKGDKGMGQWARRGAMAWGKGFGQGQMVSVYRVLHIVGPPPQQNWATPQHKPLYF